MLLTILHRHSWNCSNEAKDLYEPSNFSSAPRTTPLQPRPSCTLRAPYPVPRPVSSFSYSLDKTTSFSTSSKPKDSQNGSKKQQLAPPLNRADLGRISLRDRPPNRGDFSAQSNDDECLYTPMDGALGSLLASHSQNTIDTSLSDNGISAGTSCSSLGGQQRLASQLGSSQRFPCSQPRRIQRSMSVGSGSSYARSAPELMIVPMRSGFEPAAYAEPSFVPSSRLHPSPSTKGSTSVVSYTNRHQQENQSKAPESRSCSTDNTTSLKLGQGEYLDIQDETEAKRYQKLDGVSDQEYTHPSVGVYDEIERDDSLNAQSLQLSEDILADSPLEYLSLKLAEDFPDGDEEGPRYEATPVQKRTLPRSLRAEPLLKEEKQASKQLRELTSDAKCSYSVSGQGENRQTEGGRRAPPSPRPRSKTRPELSEKPAHLHRDLCTSPLSLNNYCNVIDQASDLFRLTRFGC